MEWGPRFRRLALAGCVRMGSYYRQASAEVMAVVRAHVTSVEIVGLDEAYLDLTGLLAPRALMRGLAAQIERRTELSCSIGIGPNKLVAKVASDADKPRGFVVLSRDEACERFAEAPCGLVPGIGPKTVERLLGLGVRTLGQLRQAPPERLGQVFGARLGAELQRRARFEDDGPVTQERKVISESRETTFPTDISDPRALRSELERLVASLCDALTAQGRHGRTIGIKVRLDDFSTHTRARTLSEPVCSSDQVGPVASELLARFAPQRPVRLLGVRVAGLEAEAQNQLRLAV
jgi:DNA polymerase-4